MERIRFLPPEKRKREAEPAAGQGEGGGDRAKRDEGRGGFAERDPDGPADSGLERRTREIGRQILERVRRYQPIALSPRWLEEQAIGRILGNDALRTALLRFVDVFPALRSDRDIALHLADYLAEAQARNPDSPLLRGTAWCARRADRSGGAKWLAAGAARLGVGRMARRFIVANDISSLTHYVHQLEERGLLFTLDVLGEAVHSEHEAEAFFGRYLDLIENLAGHLSPRGLPAPPGSGPRVNLSIKLSSLTPHFDPGDAEGSAARLRPRLRRLFQAARRTGAFVNVDMETHAARELTLKVFMDTLDEEGLRDWADAGAVVQAYLRNAEESLEALLEWVRRRGTEITVRLVKGAYWDSEQIWARQKGWSIPVHRRKSATDAQFERCLARLLDNHRLVRTAVGSHNARSLARALALAEQLDVPPGRLEIQMLHGMAEPLRRAMRDEAAPVRVYVPTGELVPGMAYLVRRLLENTSQNSFVRQMSVERAAMEALLADPVRGLAGEGGG